MKKRMLAAVFLLAAVFVSCSGREESRLKLPMNDETENIPSYVIEGFVLKSMEKGRTTWTVNARAAQVFEVKKRAYAQNVEMEMKDDGDATIFLKGDKAVIYTETGFMEMTGNVYGISDDGTVLKTEKLYWDDAEGRIFSDEKVTIIKNDTKLEGVGFESDPGMRNFEINKDVELIAEKIREKEKERD
ncbi:MAG TPA: LPS export ABC transporter periplasmic protein LptC [Firmicutes bacterium]|nr:LPS export ABC transporter periplasmic protein LptC [Bacillota bacterium]